MARDPIFGAAEHADPSSILCYTRDLAEHRLAGPANGPEGAEHVVLLRFAFGSGVWRVTFRKQSDGVFREISAVRS